MADETVLDEILEVVMEIEGIVLLDLTKLQGTWKEQVDEIYQKLQQIRALCGDESQSGLYPEGP